VALVLAITTSTGVGIFSAIAIVFGTGVRWAQYRNRR
jgi:hypothetical protein